MKTLDLSTVPLALRLLGPVEVRVHGAPLPHLRTRKGTWLLALLTLRPGHEADRAWLAGTLWPDSFPPQALTSLRKCLKDLRRALGPEAHRLHAPTPRSLALDLSGAAVDLTAFDTAIARGDPASLLEAVGGYRGPLLEGCQEEWVLPERQVREAAYLGALETLAKEAWANGDMVSAEQHLRRAVAVDPLRESAQRGLMELLAADGSYAAALLVYRELRLRLHREIHAAPAPETQALFQQLRMEARERPRSHANGTAQDPGRTRLAQRSTARDRPFDVLPPTNLPAPPTPLIGRENEVATARGLLAREEVRLLTLTGAPGIGKTRLGLQVATDLLDDFADGAFVASLAPIRGPALVPSAIAQTLGVREAGGQPVEEGLKAYLREKQVLLLLDNFEHVLGAAPLVAELLSNCPRLKVLVTSRARLRLRGEKELSVPPLALPPVGAPLAGTLSAGGGHPQPLQQYAAMELFVQRALDVKADFVLTNENTEAVAMICRRLDGLPLAIELAAGRSKLFSPPALLFRLERRLPLLTEGPRDLPARQRTLRGAIGWSYDLLDESEKRLFRRLSVFSGGCTLEAAEAVGNADGDLEIEVVDVLGSLVDKSLLLQVEPTGGDPRFGMLETIREYGLERLAASEEAATIRRHHACYFLALADQTPRGEDRTTLWEELEREHDNLRAALTWIQSMGEPCETGLRLVGALAPFWADRGYFVEGRAWLERAVSRADPSERTTTRVKALNGLGFLLWAQCDYAAARPILEESLAIAREIGDQHGLIRALHRLGLVSWSQGDGEAARRSSEECRALSQLLRDSDGIANSIGMLASLAMNASDYERAQAFLEESLAIRPAQDDEQRGQYELILGRLAALRGDAGTARSFLEESLACFRKIGHKSAVAGALGEVGAVALFRGDPEGARSYFHESLALARELGRTDQISICLAGLAGVAIGQGEPERAGRLLGAAAGLREAVGTSWEPLARTMYERQVIAIRAALGETMADGSDRDGGQRRGPALRCAAWAEGRALSLEDAIRYALQDPDADVSVP